jgi:hypothetical protein
MPPNAEHYARPIQVNPISMTKKGNHPPGAL